MEHITKLIKYKQKYLTSLNKISNYNLYDKNQLFFLFIFSIGILLNFINTTVVYASEEKDIYIGITKSGIVINGESFNRVTVSDKDTQATINNTKINYEFSIMNGAKVNINGTDLYCESTNICGQGLTVQGTSGNQLGTSELIGKNLTINSTNIGLRSHFDSYIDLNNVVINASGYGLELNGSMAGLNSISNITNIDIFNITSDSNYTAALIEFGAKAYLSNGTITATKNGATGVRLHGANTYIQDNDPIQTYAEMKNITVNTKGDNSDGVYSENSDGYGAISYWDNSTIITEGNRSYGIYSNYNSNGKIELNNNSTVTTLGDNSYGIVTYGGASISLDNSNILTKGKNSIGVYSGYLGTNILKNGSIVETLNEQSHGAVLQYAGIISLQDSTIHAKGNNAHGIYMLDGDVVNAGTNYGSSITLQNSNVVADQGYGLVADGGHLQANVLSGSLLEGSSGLINALNNTTTVNLLVDGGSKVFGKVQKAESSVANIILKNNSLWEFDADSNLTDLTNNNSRIRFVSNSDNKKDFTPFSTLIVEGDYEGSNGVIEMRAALNGDDSLSDKLIINGKATGTTNISVKNKGGQGAKTLEGIEIITTGSSESDTFKQSGRITAGSYEYHLQQGIASGKNNNNWYLTSKYISKENPTYRPESGSYISNLQAAGTMFNTTLKDRQGNGVYINLVTGEIYTSSIWIRSVGSHQKGNISDGQSNFNANKIVFQIGGDAISGSLQDNDEYHIGIMAGYANQHNRVHNNLSGYNSKGSLWGYSSGIYGTWYQNSKTNDGFYIDNWVLYNLFNNSVNGDELAYENYKSKGFTASVESGYAINIGTYPSFGETINNMYLTPQAQVIWSNVKADKHKESNGTEVKGLGNNNIQTRLGLRLSFVNEGSNLETIPVRPLMPFIEMNWMYNSKQYGVSMDNENTYLQGSRNIGEIKAGLEVDLNNNVTLWANIAQQFGSRNYQNTQGMLNLKYAF